MNAIETTNLTKKYKEKTAVDGLTLSVAEGELFALLGINGAGKSTTIRMLSCLTRPTSGEASVLGRNIMTQARQIRGQINLSPQETAVARNLSVRENLELMYALYGHKRAVARARAAASIAAFHMEEIARQRAATLSGGWQRRLSIAMALISEPQVLFLDEPTLGLDVLARRDLWKVIEELKSRITIILTTHYLEEAEALSDRVGIMAGGRLAACGTPSELIEQTGEKSFEDAFIHLAGEGGTQA